MSHDLSRRPVRIAALVFATAALLGSLGCPPTGDDEVGGFDITDPDGAGPGSAADLDGDGVVNGMDNCPDDANFFQTNSDGNGPPPSGDSHGDACDNCAHVTNENQADGDHDGVGSACDNCPGTANAGQEDSNGDGVGNACD